MTPLLVDIVAITGLVFGLFFMFVGAVGIVHLPDFYNRMHAASMCSTLGVIGLLIALLFHLGTVSLATKTIIAVVCVLLATPVGSLILGKAALRARAPLWKGTLSNDYSADSESPTDPAKPPR